MIALELATLFHDTYEQMAPAFGYETREETKAFSPGPCNGQLMLAVCEYILPFLVVTCDNCGEEILQDGLLCGDCFCYNCEAKDELEECESELCRFTK